MLEDEQLAAILRTEGGPQQWVDRLINEANRRGGLDNITAIIIRIEAEVPAEITAPSIPAPVRR
jgi:protein phosphatase